MKNFRVRLEALESQIHRESVALTMADGSTEYLHLRTCGGTDATLDLLVRCAQQGVGGPHDRDVDLVRRSVDGELQSGHMINVARLAANGYAAPEEEIRDSQ